MSSLSLATALAVSTRRGSSEDGERITGDFLDGLHRGADSSKDGIMGYGEGQVQPEGSLLGEVGVPGVGTEHAFALEDSR